MVIGIISSFVIRIPLLKMKAPVSLDHRGASFGIDAEGVNSAVINCTAVAKPSSPNIRMPLTQYLPFRAFLQPGESLFNVVVDLADNSSPCLMMQVRIKLTRLKARAALARSRPSRREDLSHVTTL